MSGAIEIMCPVEGCNFSTTSILEARRHVYDTGHGAEDIVESGTSVWDAPISASEREAARTLRQMGQAVPRRGGREQENPQAGKPTYEQIVKAANDVMEIIGEWAETVGDELDWEEGDAKDRKIMRLRKLLDRAGGEEENAEEEDTEDNPAPQAIVPTKAGTDLVGGKTDQGKFDGHVRLEDDEGVLKIAVDIFDSKIKDSSKAWVEGDLFDPTAQGAADATEFIQGYGFTDIGILPPTVKKQVRRR